MCSWVPLLCFSQASFVYVIKQWELCFLFSSPKSMMVRFTNYTLVIKRENRILTTVRMQEILIMKYSLHSIYEISRSMDEKCIGQWVCTVLMYGRAHNFQGQWGQTSLTQELKHTHSPMHSSLTSQNLGFHEYHSSPSPSWLRRRPFTSTLGTHPHCRWHSPTCPT